MSDGHGLLRSEWIEETADGAGRMSNPSVPWMGEGWHFVHVALSVMPRHRFIRDELSFDLAVLDDLIRDPQYFEPDVGAALASRVGFPTGYVLDRAQDESCWDEPTYELYKTVDERFAPIALDALVFARWLRPSQQMLVCDRGDVRMWGR